jgi:hypothetical protein
MSTHQLIKNWARTPGSFYTAEQKTLFENASGDRRLIFIASLWSGKSQMAFRVLCNLLAELDTANLPVLVLDGDSEADLAQTSTAVEIGVGEGLLIYQKSGNPDVAVAGHDTEEFRASVRRFLFSNSA